MDRKSIHCASNYALQETLSVTTDASTLDQSIDSRLLVPSFSSISLKNCALPAYSPFSSRLFIGFGSYICLVEGNWILRHWNSSAAKVQSPPYQITFSPNLRVRHLRFAIPRRYLYSICRFGAYCWYVNFSFLPFIVVVLFPSSLPFPLFFALWLYHFRLWSACSDLRLATASPSPPALFRAV